MRVQYLGIYDIIAMAQEMGAVVTTQYLTDVTGIEKSGIWKATKALEELGYIKRIKVHASHGKGRAWRYEIDLPQDMHQLIIDEFLMKKRD